MLPADPAGLRHRPGTVCVVGDDGRLSLPEPSLPADFRVRNLYEPSFPDRADRLRLALEHLHGERRFARVEFPLRGGLAFRAIQAKRAGLAFANVELAVRVNACSQQIREQAQRWPGGYEELEVDFAEQYCFEHADVRIPADPAAMAFVRRLGWAEREPAAEPAADTPLVTIGIAHHNLGRHLPATLASLAAQTYPNLEVIVIDDGSTDPTSVAAVERMEARYPQYHFVRQPNAGIGATRNHCLALARGEFFIPVDADNLARPDMVAKFVAAIRRNPDLAAMTCYFLAFEDGQPEPPGSFLYALRPTGGPHALAGIRNVYGDANAIFRTAAFRSVGGYETDRGTSCEDWEAFVKLVHAGHRIGVVPDHLFYYRHLPAGFSRRTNWFANHQRVLRQFASLPGLPLGESAAVWAALVGFHLKLQEQAAARPPLRHRIADALWAPFAAAARLFRRPPRLTPEPPHESPPSPAPPASDTRPRRPAEAPAAS